VRPEKLLARFHEVLQDPAADEISRLNGPWAFGMLADAAYSLGVSDWPHESIRNIP
jgi:hypothetical protein